MHERKYVLKEFVIFAKKSFNDDQVYDGYEIKKELQNVLDTY